MVDHRGSKTSKDYLLFTERSAVLGSTKMLRVLNNMKNLCLDTAPVVVNSININSVRWRRKPRKPIWKGTAKSKIFRVHARPEVPLEEVVEMKRLYNKYRTEVKTINRFLTSKYNVQNQQEDDQDMKRKHFEADFEYCQKLSEKWNAEQKILREARMAAELKEAIELAQQRKLITEERRALRLREAEEIVKTEKESSENFILPNMLDAEIEKALANPVDYNFALDLDGNKILVCESASPSVLKKAGSIKQ